MGRAKRNHHFRRRGKSAMGIASLHPSYETAYRPVPSGKTPPDTVSSLPAKNIPLYRNSDLWHQPNHLGPPKGRFAIVTRRGPGGGGRDGVGAQGRLQGGNPKGCSVSGGGAIRHGADSVFAGLVGERTPTIEEPSEDVRGRRSRVVLAPDAGVKSCGDISRQPA
jgi:hypothetical protein